MEKMTSKERKAAKKERNLELFRQQIRLARGSKPREEAEVFFWGEGGQERLARMGEEELVAELVRARRGLPPFGLDMRRLDPPQEAQVVQITPLFMQESTVKKPVVSPQEAQAPVLVQEVVREATAKKPADPPQEAQALDDMPPLSECEMTAKQPADSPQEAQALVMALLVAREMTARKLADSPQEAQAPVMVQPAIREMLVKKPLDSPQEAQRLESEPLAMQEMIEKQPVDPPQEAQFRGVAAAHRARTSRVGLGCFYCWQQGHRKQDCWALRTDIERGLCRLGAGYRVVRLDGSELPYMRGKSLCERARSQGRNFGRGDQHRARQWQGAEIVSVWTAVGRQGAPEARSSKVPVQSSAYTLAARQTKEDEKEEEKGDSELQALRLRVQKLEEIIDQLRRELAEQNRRGAGAVSVPEEEEDNEESGSDTATVTSSREDKAHITEVKREAEKRSQSTINVDRTKSEPAYGRPDSATATAKDLGGQEQGWRSFFFFENKGAEAF